METQPEETKIACPHCGQHLVVDESILGTELECPTCKKAFVPTAVGGETDKQSLPHDDVESSIREKRRKAPGCWKNVFVSGWTRVKHAFLRLPERAQGAALASAVFLVGIAVFSGKSESGGSKGAPAAGPSTNTKQSPPADPSAKATQAPLPRPDIKPLKDDKESARWVLSCEEGDHREILRFPEKFKGKAFYVEGKAYNVRYPKPDDKNHRGNIWIRQDGDWDKQWIVVFDDEHTKLPEGNILEDDDICVFGTLEKVHEWSGKNGFNAPVSGKSPMLMARLVSEGDHYDVVDAYEEEEENEIEAKDSDDGRESTAKGDAPKKRAQSGDFWKTDSRKTNGMYPGFFPAYAGSIHADDLKTQFDFWYDGDALSVRNDPDGKKILWIEMYDSASASGGTTVFLKVAGAKNIIAFHAALEKAFAECDGKKKPGDVLMSGVEFPSCMVYGYETSRGNRGYQGGATCAETAFGVLPEGRMFLKTTVFEPSAMKPSWWPRGKWKIDPYIVLPTAEQAKSGGEPVGKILTLTDFSYLEKCWQESKK